MPGVDEIWIPLVDEPIGQIVSRLEQEDAALAGALATPRRLLAFRTVAYIRVGIVLGRLLFEQDVPPYDGSETWADALLRDPANRAEVEREIRAVAREIEADERYAADEPIGPDGAARDRFRAFAKRAFEAA